MLGVLALMALWAVKGPSATRGEQLGLRGLLSVALKVPFSSVFIILGLNCRDINKTEMRDNEG